MLTIKSIKFSYYCKRFLRVFSEIHNPLFPPMSQHFWDTLTKLKHSKSLVQLP